MFFMIKDTNKLTIEDSCHSFITGYDNLLVKVHTLWFTRFSQHSEFLHKLFLGTCHKLIAILRVAISPIFRLVEGFYVVMKTEIVD